MGGMGSGERWRKKRTVESCDHLSISTLKRSKLLVPGVRDQVGTFQWPSGERTSSVDYRITVGPTAGSLQLVYHIGLPKVKLDYAVRLEATRCHLGGVRWWFVCPLSRDGVACGRRAAKLYLSGRWFGCRRCHDLTYRSQQTSDSRVYALARVGLGAMPQSSHQASVTQLGLALKAITLMQKRLRACGV